MNNSNYQLTRENVREQLRGRSKPEEKQCLIVTPESIARILEEETKIKLVLGINFQMIKEELKGQ